MNEMLQENFVDHLLSDDEEVNGTPSKVVSDVECSFDDLLSYMSRERYERTYREFQEWRKKNNTTSCCERTLLAYFSSVAKKCKPPSLWARYSMLAKTLKINDGISINKYLKLKAFLKKKSEGYIPTKPTLFSEQEMKKFIMEAPDSEWLVVKVVAIFSLCGAMRLDELTNLQNSHVQRKDDIFYVTVAKTKTKVARSFIVSEPFFEIVLKYINKRPPKVRTNRFFLRYVNGKCTSQVIGKHKFSTMPRRIATYLGLDEPYKYTGHSFHFRRTSTTILVNTGANMGRIKRLDAWTSTATAEGYVENSLAYKKETSNLLMSSINSSKILTDRAADKLDQPKDHLPLEVELDIPLSVGDVKSQNVQNIISNNDVRMENGAMLKQADGRNFSFHNCNVTINYVQK